jgi:hypothetical protein
MTDQLRSQTAEEKVRTWLGRQGYPLEFEAARVLRSVGFETIQGWSYRDEDEAGMVRAREIDVLATLSGKDPLFPGHEGERSRFSVAVECKHMTAPWLVLTTAHPPVWRPVVSNWMELLVNEARFSAAGAFPLPPEVGFSVKTAGDKDVAHASLMQATNAASAASVERPGGWPPEWALPLVVVRGDLFTLGYNSRGRESLTEVPWCRLVWHGADAVSFPTVVDVVTRSHLRTYARDLKRTAAAVLRAIDAYRAGVLAAEGRRRAELTHAREAREAAAAVARGASR